MIPSCTRCEAPMVRLFGFLMSWDDEEADARAQGFIERHLERGTFGVGERWVAFECQNPDCGCRCRVYLPA